MAVRTGSNVGGEDATAFATGFFGGTSFTATVFTLSGVIGAFDPGAIVMVSFARGGLSKPGAASAEAS